MQNLASEICILICTFVDVKSLLRLQQTCRRWKDFVGDPALWKYLLQYGCLGKLVFTVNGIELPKWPNAGWDARRAKNTVILDKSISWTDDTYTFQKAVVSQLLKRCVVCRRKTEMFCAFSCYYVCVSCSRATARFTKISRTRAMAEYFLTSNDLTVLRHDRRDKYGWTKYLLSDVEAAAVSKHGGRENLLMLQQKSLRA